MPAAFPIVDRNHHISTASKHVLDNAHPATWLVDSREGPNDFGYDFEVQVAPANQVQQTFRLQLKGTQSPVFSADEGTLSIGLKIRTLNLYAQSADEVMLVVVVVAFHANGKADHANSKIYWAWISDEIERLRGNRFAVDLTGEQEEVTLKVPVAQVLTPDVDVMPYLQGCLRAARAVEDLATLAKQTRPSLGGRTEPLEQLLINVRRHPELLFTTFEGDLDLPLDGIGKEIAEGLAYVRAGRTKLAEDVVQRIDRAKLGRSAGLTAGLLSLEGKVATQRRQRERALSLFEQAHEALPIEKHLLPWAELKFLAAVDREDQAGIKAVAVSLQGVQSDDGLSLLARVHTAVGDHAAAQDAVDRISTEPKRVQAELILWSSQRRWSEVREAADSAIASGATTGPHDMVGLRLIAARAAWQQAIDASPNAGGVVEVLPLTGLPGLDMEAATAAWRHALACLQLQKELGWPINVEFLAPIAVAAAGAIGRYEEALPLMRDAASVRPEYLELQENLELLAIGAGHVGVALEANLRQPENHPALVRRACIAFQAKDYGLCLAAALKVLDTMQAAVKQTPMAIAVGAAAAAKLSRISERDCLRAVLQAEPSYREFTYLSDFATASLQFAGQSQEPLNILRDGVEQYPESTPLLANLFSNLPVNEPEVAREAIDLARRLRRDMALSAADHVRLINAHVALKQWGEAEGECRTSLSRFGNSETVQALLAIALEMQGRTGDAVEALRCALELGSSRISTLRNYMGICLRLGRLKEAREAIERLLAVEGAREERIELLRLNALLLMQMGSVDDAAGVIREIGDLVSVEVETEEGMYLVLFAGLMLAHPIFGQEELRAFDERVVNFERGWPESKIFRRLTAPVDGARGLDNLYDMLDAVVGGDSRSRMREYAERERGIRTGEMPVPFAMRPSYALHYVSDVFTLWEIAKRSKPDEVQLHLSMHRADEVRSLQVRRDVPLLDLPALLVLQDLELYPVLFGLFKRIAIPRRTISYISQLSRGWLVNAAASSKAAALLEVINSNLERIDQPSSDLNAVQAVTPKDLLWDYVELASGGRWVIYSDDAITRAFATIDKPRLKAFSTLEVMKLADWKGLLTEFDIARCLAQLAKWNVGILVESRYLVAALGGAVSDDERMSAHERLERFRLHEPFASLARAIWHPGKSANELVVHMAHVVAEALRGGHSDEDGVAAMWAFWVLRTRVMLNADPEELQNILPYCLILVVNLLPVGDEARAAHTALRTLELTMDAERMSRDQERHFIERIGSCLATLAEKDGKPADVTRQKLSRAWPRGTQEGDLFESAYFERLKRPDDAS